jgi:hypothetical protein
MQGNQSPPQESGNNTTAQGLGVLYFAANVLATSIAVFIRRGFGREALSWNSLFAFGALFFLAGAAKDIGFVFFLIAFTVGQICRRAETFKIAKNGHVLHSQYAGFPYWAMKVPFVRSEKIARDLIEPVFCFTTGILLCPLSVNVGGYIVLCGIGFIVRNCMEEEMNRKRIQRMQDAQIEHEWYANQTRR